MTNFRYTTEEPTAPTAAHSIHPETHMGLVALTVSNLERSLLYYTEGLGFKVLGRGSTAATLGSADNTPLLQLVEQKGADMWPRGGISYTGLYHFAILMPGRADLGRWLRHWLSLGLPLPGQGDHLVSEALYLEDPDGNGIEIYRDRPRSEWPRVNGQLQMASDPVDIRGVLAEAEAEGKPWEGMPAGTTMGHVHLQVGDIPQARAFYNGVLGFDVIVDMARMGALFVSAGGYHHHLGMNTWHSRGQGPAPGSSVGLRYLTIHLPNKDALDEVLARLDEAGVIYNSDLGGVVVEDPWRNKLLFLVGDDR